MAKKTYDYLFKLLLIGDSGVGKTSLLFRYTEDTFSSNFIATIGIDFKIKTMMFEGKKIKLQIWDTAGQERFHTITTGYYRGAMGIMLVYDVTDRKSFEHVGRWLTTIQQYASESVEKILVANKVDAEDKRSVSTETGKAIARENSVKYFETSAKTGQNVEQAFEELAIEIYRKSILSSDTSGGSGGQHGRYLHETPQGSSSTWSCCSSN